MEPTDKNSKSTTNVCNYIEITALRNVSDNGIAKISIWKYLKFHVNAVVLNNVDLFLLAPVKNWKWGTGYYHRHQKDPQIVNS